MNRLKIVLSLAMVIAVVGAAHADVRIGGSSFFADGQLARNYQYTGPCPVDLEFHWGVIGSDSGPVSYSFVRSDGGHSSSLQSIDLPAANRSVPIIDHWQLGANTAQFADFSGWVQLDIHSPNPVSQKIGFTIHCAGPTVRVGGWSLRANGDLARDFQYTGSCPVALKFGWSVLGTAPTPVTYSFVRNDGGHSSSSQSINLPAANQSGFIYDDWQLGANTPRFASYSGWIQLDIQSPNAVSQKINFTIHCQ
ncbi:MAG TPA: hypothetical protein VI488_12890 [Candidatus Angelobacter sp.]